MENSSTKPNVWFWIISVVGLIWNGMGAMNYLAQTSMSDAYKAEIPAEQLAIIEATPAWVTGAFALAVWGGVLGCIALLLRKKWAKPILVVSLIGILGQMGYLWFMTSAVEAFGTVQGIVLPALVILIGIGLYLFAKSSIRKGWLT
ncbi:MAG: hypothetical protein OEQ81_04770 [Flavobacteriaceae bacterium]|nr:hypothetical protein [Flavobacteriaceae bacterium]